jgi:hypothetical protein
MIMNLCDLWEEQMQKENLLISHAKKCSSPKEKYMTESTVNMIVKNTITSLNDVTLKIATLFQKSSVNGCSPMGEQSNYNMIAVLVCKARSHLISEYILTRNEGG